MDEFAGYCRVCNEVHALPMTEEAKAEARSRMSAVRSAISPEKGRMIGVLIGRTFDHRRVVLQAYSGTTHLAGLGLGWAATTRCSDETQSEEGATFALLEKLSAEIEGLRWPQVCADYHEAQAVFREAHNTLQAARRQAKARRAQARREAPGDDALHERLRNASWDEGVRYRNALKALREPLDREHQRYHEVKAQLHALRAKRKQLSRRLQESFDRTHTLTNFRGASLTPDEAYIGDSPPPGTGECAVPKLLQDAARRGIRPLALAEVWVGATQSEPSRVEGTAYGPCAERCQRILGHLLCGAETPRPPALNLTVLDEGDTWIAVSKPGGLLSTPGRGEDKLDSVLTRVRRHWGRGAAARAVHRLDMDTSGVMLLATDAESQGVLQKQFIARRVEKTYLAWVTGELEPATGEITLPLGSLEGQSRKQTVDPQGRNAISAYEVLGSSAGRSLVVFYPRTGRTHQLRVHALEGLGAPIIGDELYGVAGEHLVLHAWRLQFTDPSTNAHVSIMCPLPDHWPPETLQMLPAGVTRPCGPSRR